MSRTPLFAAVRRALALSLRDSSVVWPQSSALTRRRLLRLSAAAAGAAALSPLFEWSAYAKKKARHGKHGPYSIGIVGGGVAGLTAAYRLQAAGVKPVVFEASNRWGGRMFTQYDFYKGMFCDLGANLWTPVMKICRSLARSSVLRCRNSPSKARVKTSIF
jgi:monoamine oxidase